ncbi:MAG: histidine kinase, partial [Marinilabiliales bacterium]|nr:histidine kinase [Marinilabiliales bacterium]
LYTLMGCFAYSLAMILITRNGLDFRSLGMIFVLMVFQVELFAWIGNLLMRRLTYHSVKEFVRAMIGRLLIFYLLVVLISGVVFVAVGAAVSLHNGEELAHFFRELPGREARGFIIGSSFGLLTGTVIFFFMELIAAVKKEQELKEEKMRYHFETLKNQLNPHFLFNSLHTLSSLIYSDVAVADQFILKLSSVYRYILDQQETKMVDLSKELTFVRDFFYLQQLRDGNRIQLEVSIDDPTPYRILPVSLQLLVENALKHNAASTENPLLIRISKHEEGYLKVENNIQPKQHFGDTFKIGLKNLGERVAMITGKELKVSATEAYFTVLVPILPA